MLPRKTPTQPRVVRHFEVITPAGQVYQFPHVSLLRRLARLAGAHAGIAAISATIFIMIYIARLAGEELALLGASMQVARQVGFS